MTSSPPQLGDEDLRERLREVFRIVHRSHLVALTGVGAERLLSTDVGAFRIIPVVSEIDLRRRLSEVDAQGGEDPHVAFLVPWSGQLPLDVGGRFANGGRILPLGRDMKLRRLFGATEIDEAALASPLSRFLVERTARDKYPSRGGRLTLDAMWTAWLREECRVFDKDDVSLVALMAWAVSDGGGAAFRTRLESDSGVHDALLAFLDARLGPAAPLVWKAWESGQGGRALELAVLLEAIASANDPAVKMWRTLKVQTILGLPAGELQLKVIKALAESASPTLRALAVREEERLVQAAIVGADALADVDEVRRAAAASQWLPSAWNERLDRLGAILSEAASAPSAKLLDAAAALLRGLEPHERFHREAKQGTYVRAEMACRLLAWLLDPLEERYPSLLARYSDVNRLARWYAHEGGFVDWARRAARTTPQNAFSRGVAAIVAVADAKRTALDRAFGKALPAWLEAQRPADKVLPIHQAIERFVCLPLEAAQRTKSSATIPDRRFLVLLLDGMAWAQAVELLQSLTSWGPVAWNTSHAMKVEAGAAYAPVLAHLPSITEVSRASFFAGKDPVAGRHEPTSKDEERWRDHPLQRFFAAGDKPRLLLRAEGHTKDGSASLEALNAVRDGRVPVVAMVINAIDASLKGDTQQVSRWDLTAIKPLRDLLDAARDAGRLVLIASDHGHVPADRLVSCGSPADSGARWRPWRGEQDTVAEYEVLLTKTVAWAPRNAPGVVLLTDDEHRYGGAAHAGEHGGATLAEVVAPTVLLGYDTPGMPVAAQDPEMRVGPAYVPRWWYFEIEAPRVVDRAPAVATVQQLSLLSAEPSAVAVATKKPVELALHPLALALEQTDLFRKRELDPARRRRVLEVVSYLAARDDQTATIAGFSAALGLIPQRAPGLVAALAEWLNVDGYPLLSHETNTQRIELDVAKLKSLYGIS